MGGLLEKGLIFMGQKLILPINDAYITAGYKSQLYKNYWKFNHYGMDMISVSGTRKLYSLGNGVVVSAGMDGAQPNLRLGNVLVIKYENVSTNTGKTLDLICRMYHLDKIYVNPGDRITQKQIIADYGNTGYHTTGAHLHIEFDTDTDYPNYAFGVSNGGKIIKRGTIDSSVSPDDVWFVGDEQSITGSSSGWVAPDEKDAPRIPEEEDPTFTFKMGSFKSKSDAETFIRNLVSIFEKAEIIQEED